VVPPDHNESASAGVAFRSTSTRACAGVAIGRKSDSGMCGLQNRTISPSHAEELRFLGTESGV